MGLFLGRPCIWGRPHPGLECQPGPAPRLRFPGPHEPLAPTSPRTPRSGAGPPALTPMHLAPESAAPLLLGPGRGPPWSPHPGARPQGSPHLDPRPPLPAIPADTPRPPPGSSSTPPGRAPPSSPSPASPGPAPPPAPAPARGEPSAPDPSARTARVPTGTRPSDCLGSPPSRAPREAAKLYSRDAPPPSAAPALPGLPSRARTGAPPAGLRGDRPQAPGAAARGPSAGRGWSARALLVGGTAGHRGREGGTPALLPRRVSAARREREESRGSA